MKKYIYILAFSGIFFGLNTNANADCPSNDMKCLSAAYAVASKGLQDSIEKEWANRPLSSAPGFPLTEDWHLTRKTIGKPERVNPTPVTQSVCESQASNYNDSEYAKIQQFGCKKF